jgi:phage terminase large subunit GpA-like protein
VIADAVSVGAGGAGGVRDERAWVRGLLSAAWQPRERLSVAEWAARYRRVHARASANPGPWRNDLCPYLVGIMEAFDDPGVSDITVMKASQVGFTEALYNMVMWLVDTAPGPCLFVYPSHELAKSVNRDRLVPNLLATPRMARLLEEAGEDAVKAGQLRFSTGVDAWFVGAGNEANLKSRPIQYVLLDEIDEFPDGAVETALKRTQAYPGLAKRVRGSSPTYEGVGVHGEYMRSDRRRYEVPCPHCGVYQRLTVEHVRWEGGLAADARTAETSACYACPECGGVVRDHQKPAMLRRGVWLREGQRVESPCPDGGAPRIVGQGVRSTHAGFLIDGLLSPFVSFGQIARDLVQHKGQPPPAWWNHVAGDVYRQPGRRAEVALLRRHCLDVAAGGYAVGTVPAGVLALTGAVDVQRDRAYVEVVGWGERGEQRWLVWYGVVPAPFGTPGALLERCRDLAAMRFPFADAAGSVLAQVQPESEGGAKFARVRRWAIDSGEGTRTAEVYDVCRALGPESWVPCKGVPGLGATGGMAAPYATTRIDRYPDGRPMPGGLVLLKPNTHTYKSQILQRLLMEPPRQAGLRAARHARPEEVGLEMLQGAEQDGAEVGRWWLPAVERDADGRERRNHDEYLAQLCAEELRQVKVAGRITWKWEQRTQRAANHMLDCAVYNWALADYSGVRYLTVEELRRSAGDGGDGGDGGGAGTPRAPGVPAPGPTPMPGSTPGPGGRRYTVRSPFAR